MTTDRELLELAAKAAGLHLVWDYDEYLSAPCVIDADGFTEEWNPLDNDGDALRLAVKCALKISHTTDSVIVSANGVVKSVRSYHGRPCAATRRAIVHAAARLALEPTMNRTDECYRTGPADEAGGSFWSTLPRATSAVHSESEEGQPTYTELLAQRDALRAEVERLRTDGASAVRWAPGSAYWSEVLVELFGPDARRGIDVLETRWRNELERANAAEALLRQALEALEYARDLTKLDYLQECNCPICTTIAALRERLDEKGA